MPRKKEELIHKQCNDTEVIDFENFGVACSVLARRSIMRGVCKYPDTSEGLQTFKERTQAYFDFVEKANMGNEKGICSDVESWAISLGCTRQTILNYRSRSGDWAEFIDYTKEIILAQKKAFAFSGRIPPLLAIFDLTNNHGYYSTSEFSKDRLMSKRETEKSLSFVDLCRIGQNKRTEGADVIHGEE